jgi:hypothetical protein
MVDVIVRFGSLVLHLTWLMLGGRREEYEDQEDY